MSRIARAAALPAVALMFTAGLTPSYGGTFKDEALATLATLEKKVVSLAEAVPAEKYTWRPAEGVRSFSEVFLHIAAANYGIPRVIGTPPPEGFQFRGYDKLTTDKAEVLKKLKASFAHARKAVEALDPADADKPVKMFGSDTTVRGVCLRMIEHLGEHLGQSIAYARMNGVVPPWSRK